MSNDAPAPMPRRHDLDALRAIAMLLGIALHAGLSFDAMFWPVQDTRQNSLFGLMFGAIHGFRMPLFFIISGFFTAMLIERRGLTTTLKHRSKRILLPLLLGILTIVPVTYGVIIYAATHPIKKASTNRVSEQKVARSPNSEPAPDQAEVPQLSPETASEAVKAVTSFLGSFFSETIYSAARKGDTETVAKFIDEGADLEKRDAQYKLTPLAHASLYDQTTVVKLLLENGANVDPRSEDGGTPLIAAAFFGYADTAEVLLQHGADPTVRNKRGESVNNVIQAPWEVTKAIGGFLGLKLDQAEVDAGRKRIAKAIHPDGPSILQRYEQITAKPVFTIPAYHHLWFLAFLCWLCCGLFVVIAIGRALNLPTPSRFFSLSWTRVLWLIPLTMLPQWIMGRPVPHFGPDTSIGLLPVPHILFYYAVFFGFGALYWAARDSGDWRDARLGRFWIPTMLLAIAVVFPIGLEFSTGGLGFADDIAPKSWRHPLSVFLQASYAWMMSFAAIGMFRRLFSGESRAMRYISDSSYWLYVAHLPLVMALQFLVRSWPLPAVVKFGFVCASTTLLLLITYQYCVRYTWIGRLLNGPRKRVQTSAPASIAA